MTGDTIKLCTQIDRGCTLNIIFDIDGNKIDLIPDNEDSTISFDLICIADFSDALHSLVSSGRFQSALKKQLIEHSGRCYTENLIAV